MRGLGRIGAVARAPGLAAALVIGASADSAMAQAEPGLTLGWVAELVSNAGTYLAGATVLGGVLGFLGKWLFDEASASIKARRDFAQKVTDQVADLAKTYYWSLANHAGVVAGLLEEYLALVDHHLLLAWPGGRQDLEQRLGDLADEAAQQSFCYFCRLVWLFDQFQLRGSNTYLLTTDAAGRVCRRLYNSFMASLPVGEATRAQRLDTLVILKVMAEKVSRPGSEEPVAVAEMTPAGFNALVEAGELKEVRAAYREWLAARLPDVAAAAEALRAYNEVLSHELARLYRPFFGWSPVSVDPYAEAVAFDLWPHVLTAQSVRAINRAWRQGELLRPPGLGGLPGADRQEKALADEHGQAAASSGEDVRELGAGSRPAKRSAGRK